MGITVRELITKLAVNITDTKKVAEFDAKIGAARAGANAFGRNLKDLAASTKAFGAAMTFGLTLPIIGATAAMLKFASDAEETRSKFATVFSSIRQQAEMTADEFAKSFGLAGSTSRQLLSNTGDLLVGFGFAEDSALDLSRQVNGLAVDLASFTNFEGGARGASDALTKALLGERDSVKSLGIAILDVDVQQRLAEKGQKGLTGSSLRQAKAWATLEIALEQSKKAQGDFARTQGGLANQVRKFQEATKGLAEEFGENLIPEAIKIVEQLQKMAKWFANLSEPMQSVVLGSLGLLAVLGPLIFLMGSFAQVVLAVQGLVAIGFVPALIAKAAVLWANVTAWLALHAATGGIILGIIALVAGLVLLVMHFKQVKEFAVEMKDSIVAVFDELFEKFPLLKNVILGALLPIWGPIWLLIKGIGLLKKVVGGGAGAPAGIGAPGGETVNGAVARGAMGDAVRRGAGPAGGRNIANTLSAGDVVVNVQGSTNMGPNEIRRATQTGVDDGLASTLRRMELNAVPVGG